MNRRHPLFPSRRNLSKGGAAERSGELLDLRRSSDLPGQLELDRMIENLSAILACRAIYSQISIPEPIRADRTQRPAIPNRSIRIHAVGFQLVYSTMIRFDRPNETRYFRREPAGRGVTGTKISRHSSAPALT